MINTTALGQSGGRALTTIKGDQNRSSSSASASEAHWALHQLAHFHHWLLRADFLEQMEHFLGDVRNALHAQDCALYLEGLPSGMLALHACTEQASTVFPSHLAMPDDPAFWHLVRDQWV